MHWKKFWWEKLIGRALTAFPGGVVDCESFLELNDEDLKKLLPLLRERKTVKRLLVKLQPQKEVIHTLLHTNSCTDEIFSCML